MQNNKLIEVSDLHLPGENTKIHKYKNTSKICHLETHKYTKIIKLQISRKFTKTKQINTVLIQSDSK